MLHFALIMKVFVSYNHRGLRPLWLHLNRIALGIGGLQQKKYTFESHIANWTCLIFENTVRSDQREMGNGES